METVLGSLARLDSILESGLSHEAGVRLPFRIRPVVNSVDLRRAVRLRANAYGRHSAEMGLALSMPEPDDYLRGSVVFVAESKLDGSVLGTMRVQTNEYKPLPLERSFQLPEQYQGARLGEACRLGVVGDKTGSFVKMCLFKAYYQYCRGAGIDHMVVAVKRPVYRQYKMLWFTDLSDGYIPMQHAANLPHIVMALDVKGAEALWTERKQPMLNFFVNEVHVDIDPGISAPPITMVDEDTVASGFDGMLMAGMSNGTTPAARVIN